MDFDRIEYYRSLERGDLNETYFMVRSALETEVAIYMTLLFGFLTVAYVVAQKLSRFQSISLVSLYSVFSLWLTFGIVDATVMLADVSFAISGEDTYLSVYINFSLLTITWLISILLFIQAHRKERDD